MATRTFLILPLVLALNACVHRTAPSFPGNLSAMPVVDAGHYDNPIADAAQDTGHRAARFVETIAAEAAAAGIPGVVLLVDTPDGTWVSAKGVIDLKNQIPMGRDSLSRIGSITKMFTAVVVHQLAQEGKLALDDPASKYPAKDLTCRIAGADRATVRQLLGLIAEKTAGKPMKDLYRERIFAPLGMESTYYDPYLPVQRGVARGYVELSAGNPIDTTDFDQATRTPDGASSPTSMIS